MQSNFNELEKAGTSGFKFCDGDTDSTRYWQVKNGQARNKRPLTEMIDECTKLDVHASAEMFVKR